ncbi:MAG: TIGR02281 family clan AA aspartic protease [Sphingomonas sp.]|nr:TIGR02281 family clan AA aspartic protease [Sphingomonas sp.]
MSSNAPEWVMLIILVGFLVFLMSRSGEPIGKLAKMALAWVGIFALFFVVFTFRDDFSYVAQRVSTEISGQPVIQGDTLRVPKAIDGHFYLEADVNGATIEFMVDSGATVTTLGQSAAREAGLQINGQPNVIVQTANGTVGMYSTRARDFDVGPIERNNMRVHVAERDDLNVIGMNWLSSLDSWRVEGDWLILQP